MWHSVDIDNIATYGSAAVHCNNALYGNKCNIFIKSFYVELKPNFMKESLLTLLLTILTLDSCQLQLKDKTGIFRTEFSGFIE